jgi:hypothetical protein
MKDTNVTHFIYPIATANGIELGLYERQTGNLLFKFESNEFVGAVTKLAQNILDCNNGNLIAKSTVPPPPIFENIDGPKTNDSGN